MKTNDYFEGFNWPVPRGFSDALTKCRFEQGDVLYSDRCAYELKWGDAKKDLEYSIQIISPSRSVGTSSSDGREGVFLSNWNSEVVFEITNYKTGKKERKKTFQGNLYMTVLRGDPSFIEQAEVQMPPLTVSEIDRRLPYTPVEKTKESQFLLAFDATNEILRVKKAKIENALKSDCSIQVYPAHSIPTLSKFPILPTISIVAFDVGLSLPETEAAIKEAVYVPAKNKKTDSERFRLRDHGLLR